VLIERVCLALMLALVGDVFLGVFSRYILQATFQWYDEVARLCFIWIVFLGAAVAVKRGMHSDAPGRRPAGSVCRTLRRPPRHPRHDGLRRGAGRGWLRHHPIAQLRSPTLSRSRCCGSTPRCR
jgi:hypothetical protein